MQIYKHRNKNSRVLYLYSRPARDPCSRTYLFLYVPPVYPSFSICRPVLLFFNVRSGVIIVDVVSIFAYYFQRIGCCYDRHDCKTVIVMSFISEALTAVL